MGVLLAIVTVGICAAIGLWMVHRAPESTPPKPIDNAVRVFTKAILHGDEKHRRWLLEAAEQFIKDGTVPPQK